MVLCKGKGAIERERGKTVEAAILGGKGCCKGQREKRKQNWRDLFIRTFSCCWWCIFVNELRPKQKPTGLHNQQWEACSWRWWHPETGCFPDRCLTLLPSRSLSHSHEGKLSTDCPWCVSPQVGHPKRRPFSSAPVKCHQDSGGFDLNFVPTPVVRERRERQRIRADSPH